MKEIADVRPSPIAGTWYSGDPIHLARQVDGFLSAAQLPALTGEVIALIAPHAGLRYSGPTAGHAFAAVRGQRRPWVVVVSPLHSPHPADLLTTAHHAYATPLGDVPVDAEAVARLEALLEQDGLKLARIANDREHSLEIELPFAQRALEGPFLLLPVMVRSQSPLVARLLGQALAKAVQGQNALLVASTDLSHFYPQDIAAALDQEMLRRVASFAPNDLFEAERSGKGYACGVGATAAVLWAARALGADAVQVVHHSTSGDETGDYAQVVGYGAAVVLKHT